MSRPRTPEQREEYQSLRAAGLCPTCRAPAVPGRALCQRCLDRNRARSRCLRADPATVTPDPDPDIRTVIHRCDTCGATRATVRWRGAYLCGTCLNEPYQPTPISSPTCALAYADA